MRFPVFRLHPESATYRDRMSDFTARGARVYGVSTQRPEDQEAFATRQRLSFPLLSDQELRLAAGLRLPTFRAAGSDWLKRGTLLVGSDREIRGVLYPISDPPAPSTTRLPCSTASAPVAMRVEAVVADLDGTLVGEDSNVSQATLESLRTLRAAGIPLVIATGGSRRTCAVWIASSATHRSRSAAPAPSAGRRSARSGKTN